MELLGQRLHTLLKILLHVSMCMVCYVVCIYVGTCVYRVYVYMCSYGSLRLKWGVFLDWFPLHTWRQNISFEPRAYCFASFSSPDCFGGFLFLHWTRELQVSHHNHPPFVWMLEITPSCLILFLFYVYGCVLVGVSIAVKRNHDAGNSY